MDDWKNKSYSYFQNKSCEFFPCHKGADADNFNCLFCWCPLYALGDRCGGNFTYTGDGVKDCSGCLLPHHRDGYGDILRKFDGIKALAEKHD